MSLEDAYAGRPALRQPSVVQSETVNLTTGDYTPPWVPTDLYVVTSGDPVQVTGRLKGDAADRAFAFFTGVHRFSFVLIRKVGTGSYDDLAGGVNGRIGPVEGGGTHFLDLKVLRSTE